MVTRAEFEASFPQPPGRVMPVDFRPRNVHLRNREGHTLCFGAGTWRGAMLFSDHAVVDGEDVLLYDVERVYATFPIGPRIYAWAVRAEGLRPDTGDHEGDVHHFCPVGEIVAADPEAAPLVLELAHVVRDDDG
jgi:hypothetical protein